MRHNIRNDYERGNHISAVWDAVQRGVFTWQQAQQAQTAAQPTCDCCRREPSIVKSERSARFLCTECYARGQR